MFVCTNEIIEKIAMDCARGCYQRDLAAGRARASGSDRRGQWTSSNFRSREAWLARVMDAGVKAFERRVGTRLFVVLAATEAGSDAISDEELMSYWR